MLTMSVTINRSIDILWGIGFRFFWSSLLFSFITPVLYGSYVCRALRLAVVFHPRAKRALPWLIPVKKMRTVTFFPKMVGRHVLE